MVCLVCGLKKWIGCFVSFCYRGLLSFVVKNFNKTLTIFIWLNKDCRRIFAIVNLKHKQMNTEITTINKLITFVNQRPGLEPANYSDYRSYRNEAAEIVKDKADFYSLLALASRRLGNRLETELTEKLRQSNGRLSLTADGQIQYITGQYFPTEYRPAACALLSQVIWEDYRVETNDDGTAVYFFKPYALIFQVFKLHL